MAWPDDDWRYGHPDWTLVTDAMGSRFVERAQRKRRRAPRALRFEQLKVGAVLLKRTKNRSIHYDPPFMEAIANDNGREEIAIRNEFAIVEDRWFDPCQGQFDRLKGEMASVRPVGPNGAWQTKLAHTLRGLASQGFDHVSDEAADRIRAFVKERAEIIAAWTSGEISTSEAQLRASSYRRMMEELTTAH